MPALTWEDRCELAERYAPHLVLFPEEQALGRPGKFSEHAGDYHPRGIALLLERSVLNTGRFRPRERATIDSLAKKNADAQLVILGKRVPDPDFAWRSYFDLLDARDQTGTTGRERFPVTVYARVLTRAEANRAGDALPVSQDEVGRPFFKREGGAAEDDVSIQYWLAYYYDDWANQHEGDWEGINLFLRRTSEGYAPVGAGYYSHETGTRRRWSDIERSQFGGDHPLVYVAAGSHASYFQYTKGGYVVTVPGLIVPVLKIKLKVSFSTTQVDLVPDKERFSPVAPRVEMLPDPVGPPNSQHPAWEHDKWLAFPGSWGIRPLYGFGYGGPRGPRFKGLKWHKPFVWVERHCAPDFLVY